MTNPSALSTDLYQLTMMAAYVRHGLLTTASFELFARRLPPRRNFLVAAGLDPALEYLSNLRFSEREIAYLRGVPELQQAPESFFAEYLPSFRFTGEVHAMPEGTPVFANEPLLRVTAPLPEAQLVETALLAIVGFSTSVASRTARIVHAARGRPVIEFGARRAHGTGAGALAARAAYLAGCVATSNVEAGIRWNIPVSGTMAHSWVLAHDEEIDAFRHFASIYGERAVLLVDTYDTLAAIDRFIADGLRPSAIRIDSGDLAALGRAARAKLDAAGLHQTRLVGSGDLDEDAIARLLDAGAPYDAFGVGSAIAAVTDAPSLGAVYKLVEIERGGVREPLMKHSEGKVTHPGCKQIWRSFDGKTAVGDVVAASDEPGPSGARALLRCVMRNGQRVGPSPSLASMRDACREHLAALPPGLLELSEQAPYPVQFSQRLEELSERIRQSLATNVRPDKAGRGQ